MGLTVIQQNIFEMFFNKRLCCSKRFKIIFHTYLGVVRFSIFVDFCFWVLVIWVSRRCCSQSVGWVDWRAVAWDGGCAIKKALVTDRGNAAAQCTHRCCLIWKCMIDARPGARQHQAGAKIPGNIRTAQKMVRRCCR